MDDKIPLDKVFDDMHNPYFSKKLIKRLKRRNHHV